MPTTTRTRTRPRPVWAGPGGEGPQGGITSSLLSRFLCCRERFRIHTLEGLVPQPAFNHRLEFGNMWHLCEEYAGRDWGQALYNHTDDLARRYPTDREQILHWYNVCHTTFPIYRRWWEDHPDVTARQVLLPETVFDVSYTLPSDREVRLRGRWDSVDLIGRGNDAGVYLQENKTKADIKPEQLRRQLTFDLQTMLYVVAYHTDAARMVGHVLGRPAASPVVSGVIYNVVRRPLSGGRGSIVRHKPTKKNPVGEQPGAFYGRLEDILTEAHGSEWGCNAGEHHFFQRWKVEVSEQDIKRFKAEFLDPCLENLAAWYDIQTYAGSAPERHKAALFSRYGMAPVHWRHPFGVYNTLDEGGSSDLDNYIATGSTAGLVRTDDMFPELHDD
jgi:hypothetical protein